MQVDGYNLNELLRIGLAGTDKTSGETPGVKLVSELYNAALKGLKKGDLTAFSMIREMLKEGSLKSENAGSRATIDGNYKFEEK